MAFRLINEEKESRKEKGESVFIFLTIKFASKRLVCNLILWWPACHCICLDH